MAKEQLNDEMNDDVLGDIDTRTRIYLEGPDRETAPLVDKLERTTVGEDGMTESVDIRLRQAAGCQHVLHTGAEIGGVCANQNCNAILCVKCATDKDNLCDSCGRPVCGNCKKDIWLRAKENIMCPRCARRWWFREIRRALIVAVLVFLLLLVSLRRLGVLR